MCLCVCENGKIAEKLFGLFCVLCDKLLLKKLGRPKTCVFGDGRAKNVYRLKQCLKQIQDDVLMR